MTKMISFKYSKAILMVSCTFLCILSACTPHLGGSDYTTNSVGEISNTFKGTIIAARVIKIRKDQENAPGIGAVGGAASGALLGSTIGGGHKAPLAAAVIGGLAGGFAGDAIEKKLNEQDGMEYQIQLSDQRIITIAQGMEPRLSVGQKVLLIQSNKYNGRSRVIADHT